MRWLSVLGIVVAAHLATAPPGSAQSDCRQTGSGVRPALNCIDLHPTSATRAKGSVRMLPPDSPFGVSVDARGLHRYRLVASISGLPNPSAVGGFTVYIAWSTDPAFRDVRKLGPVTNGTTDLGIVARNKFLLLISAEPDTSVRERTGPLILRGQSPSTLLQPHDLLSLTPLAAFQPGPQEDSSAHGQPSVKRPAAPHQQHPNGHAVMPPPPSRRPDGSRNGGADAARRRLPSQG